MVAQKHSLVALLRLSVLALCCVVQLSARQTFAFDSDKLYKYAFEGAITSKVADDERPQYSGVAMQAQILVKKSGPDELTVRLDEPRTATFNELIEEIHLYKFNYEPLGEQAHGLDRAFRIYFDGESGAVKSFDSHKDEQKWVTNFKRGLLSFFQLKLKWQQPTSALAPPTSASAEESGLSATNAGQLAASQSNQYYSTLEKSVFGDCETDYLVMMEPINNGGGGGGEQSFAINVTKTRNMARCKSRFLHRFFPIDSNECAENEKELRQYKHSSAIFQYDLLGTRQNYAIQQVLVDEQSTFAPFGQRAHGHLIHSKFMMKLVDIEPGASGPQPDDSALVKLESLSYDPPEMMNFYANIDLALEHHLSSIYQSSANVDQVMLAFDELVAEHRDYTAAFEAKSGTREQESSRLGELFIRLNELVGTLNLQKIEQLYVQVDERGEAHKKIFWDLMSIAGTNPSFVFMKRLITDGDAPSVKIKDFLTRLSYHIKMPSKTLFDEYVNLCKSDKIQTNQQYKRLCSLPLASLIHQHCAKPHAKFLRMQQEGAANATAYKRGQNTCQIATAEEYFARLVAPLPSVASGAAAAGAAGAGSSASAEEFSIGDKMLNIKMAGELGVRPSIDYLADLIANQEEQASLRSAAMWQLYKAARVYPSQVKRLVVPYFYNRHELLELRLAAFHNWLAAGMPLHEMETMSKRLMSEPSRQLVIYVHSLMASLAKLDAGIPCAHSSDRNARLVLPAIRRALALHSAPSLTDSHAALTSSWQPEFGYGTTSLMSIIFANDSMAPSNIFYSSSEIMSGLKLTPMSVSIQAHGLDKLVKRVIGINGLLADKESFMDVFSLKRRSRRQVTADLIKQEAQEIDKELKLSAREFNDVYVAITVSAYGRPISFFDRDSRELKTMLSEDGTIRIPAIKKLLHSFNNHTTQQMLVNFEKLEVFNNELGLPLYQSINDFDYKTIKLNSIKLDVEPGFFRDERQGKPPTKFGLALDAKMSRHNEMLVSSGSLVPSRKRLVGVGFYKKKLLNIPMRVALEVNLTHNQVSIKHAPIHESLLYVKQTPVTFIRSYDPALPRRSLDVASSWRELFAMNNTALMESFKLDYMTPLAIGLRLEGKHRTGQDWSMSSWRRHISSVGLAAAKFMYTYSPTGQPLEARLSTISTEENPTRELVELFSWRHHHNHQQYGLQSRDSAPPSESLNEIERELEATTGSQPSSQEGPPSTVSYRLALLGGTTRERRVSVDLSYSRSFDRLLHKWRVFYSRTPLDSTATSELANNLCWLGQMQFPRHPADKLLNFELQSLDHSANLTSELSFGDQECQESKQQQGSSRVSARVAFEWSQEQRRAIEWALGLQGKVNEVSAEVGDNNEHVVSEQRRNVYAQLYKKCLAKRQEHGAKLEPACLQLLRRTGELRHISAQFDYKEVPEHWTKLVRRLGGLYTYARAGYIEELDDKPTGAPDYYKSADGSRERAHLEANISAPELGHERKLSYEFDTPSYHVMYKNVPISLPPLSTFPLLGSSFYQQIQSRTGSANCLVSGQTVTTFDNYTYKMPAVGDGCFKLIAKDCSPEANYVVLGAKVNQTGKVVKVYIAQKFKVEFVPEKDGKKISDIKVNGETVQIEQGKPPLKRDTKLDQKTTEAFSIDYNGAYYTLNSKLYKFSVSTDGTWIFVQQSKYYSGKSCGLCGDSNGDHLLEFKSPRKRVCRNANDFVWSYVLPSTCASKPSIIECA